MRIPVLILLQYGIVAVPFFLSMLLYLPYPLLEFLVVVCLFLTYFLFSKPCLMQWLSVWLFLIAKMLGEHLIKIKKIFPWQFLIFTARTLGSLIFLQFRCSASVRIIERKKLKFLASTNFIENILRQIKLVTDNDYCNHAFI